MIIYFTPGGRLGNQFFQLAFTASMARPRERIIFSQMDRVLSIVESGLRIIRIPRSFVRFLDKIFIPFLFKPLIRLRIITHVFHEEGGVSPIVKRGLFSRIRYFEGYFQSESFFDRQKIVPWRVAESLLHQARTLMNQSAQGRPVVFVHVRRTDYLHFQVLGRLNPTLPLAYYHRLLKWFLENWRDPIFLFLSDDPAFVEREFAEVERKIISRQTPEVDFALMTLCQGAILANSTLAWWGAYLMRDSQKVFAPEYWLGWQSCRWFPQGIKPSFADIVPCTTWSGQQ